MKDWKKLCRVLLLLCGGILLVLCLMALENRTAQQYRPLHGAARGNPVYSTERYNTDKMTLTQLAADGDRVYLLYGDTGVLEVYDPAGYFQYSYAFCDDLNGQFALALENELLYVEDCHCNLYILENGLFREYLEEASCRPLRFALRFDAVPTGYSLKNGNVWKTSESGEICLIRRRSSAQLMLVSLSSAILICGIGFRLWRRRTRK